MKYKTFIPFGFRPRVKGEELNICSHPKKHKMEQQKKLLKKSGIVCTYVSEDSSQAKVLKNQFPEEDLFFLEYDDLGSKWNFEFRNGQFVFFTEEYELHPIGIYARPYCPQEDHPSFHFCNHYLRAFESWKGKKIGASSFHFHNSSKGYQLTTTIRQAIKMDKKGTFTFPRSFFIKGIKSYNKLKEIGFNLIVKSNSGIRSKVSTQDVFLSWEEDPIKNLPTFFQEACLGPDIRVHCFKEKSWQVILHRKEGSIDYRYAKREKPFEKLERNEEIEKFCMNMSTLEGLQLVGADFIQRDGKYFCLECNPNPGWAGFHRHCKDEPLLAKHLIDKLR